MATLELSMIVKNGADGLERCLRSVAGLVDRIVIGDTGSTDETAEIAQVYEAEIFNVPWTGNFAAARNAVLARAKCDWILVLDADEMLGPFSPERLHALLADEETTAWNMRGLNYVTDTDMRCNGRQAVRNSASIEEAGRYPAYFESAHTRLFRRDPRIVFEHCVHETVAPSVDRAGLLRRDCELKLHHFGFVEDLPERRSEKAAYYHELGLRKIARAGNDARAYLEAGISSLDYAKDPRAALPLLEQSAALNPNSALVWLYLGLCSTRVGKLAEAQAQLSRSVRLEPRNCLACCAIGDVYFQQQSYAEAGEAYRHAQVLGDHSRLTEAKLGAAEVQTGLVTEGLAKVQAAAAAEPGRIELQRVLATSAVSAGEMGLACAAAERCVMSASALAFDFLLGASVFLQAAQPGKAETAANAGLQRCPEDSALRQVLAAAKAAAESLRSADEMAPVSTHAPDGGGSVSVTHPFSLAGNP